MASGDNIPAGQITDANDTTFLNAANKVENEYGILGGMTEETDFSGNVIFQVGPHSNPFFTPGHDLIGVLGLGLGATGQGVKGVGQDAGVFGDSDGGGGNGVRGHSAGNDGVVGLCDAGGKSGVFGFNSTANAAAFGV